MPTCRVIAAASGLMLLGLAGLGSGWWLARSPADASPSLEDVATVHRPATRRSDRAATPADLPVVPPSARRASPRFIDVAARHGVAFSYVRGETGDYWLPETMGGGVGWIDYDGDGRPDLYLVQGCQLPEDRTGAPANVLYRNTGSGRWSEVPRWATAAVTAYGMGVAVGDVDNDGFDDIYVTNFGPHAFYHNQGDGTFREAAASFGLGSAGWGTSAAFGDLNRDGNLDLFVANYVEHDPRIVCRDPITNRRVYCGPDYYAGQQDLLYENSGDGRFADVSTASGIAPQDGKGLGVVIADLLDDDGWPDIFVANDLRHNLLFRNKAGGRSDAADAAATPAARAIEFDEVGFELGAAVNGEGVREANMGIACGDFDGDGHLDLYVTHYYMEHDTLWKSQDGKSFHDVTKMVGLSLPTLPQLSWGTNVIDCDNDGWLDLFVTSGHINDSNGGAIPYAMRPQLFQNLSAAAKPGRFVDVSTSAGPYFLDQFVGRGSAAADFDRDGAMDLAVTHHHRPAAILANRTSPRGSAIGFRLVGRRSNRSAIGARVTVTVAGPSEGERRLMREVVGGGSYLSADTRDVLVGLGDADRAARVEVRWPSGLVSRFEGLEAGRYWTVREGAPLGDGELFESASDDGLR